MERDSRRGNGQWRGVHSFKDITCDGDGVRNPKRNGGLKMGHDYWYYVGNQVPNFLALANSHSTNSTTGLRYTTRPSPQRPHVHISPANQSIS
jgi:hypothetical protein